MTDTGERYDLPIAVRDNAAVEADRLEQEALLLEDQAWAKRQRALGLRQMHALAIRFTVAPLSLVKSA